VVLVALEQPILDDTAAELTTQFPVRPRHVLDIALHDVARHVVQTRFEPSFVVLNDIL